MRPEPALLKQQNGMALITAIFLITGLAVLGALSTKMMVISSHTTINELQSSRALFAAESGSDWGAHYVQYTLFPASACPAAFTAYGGTQDVVAGQSQFAVEIKCKRVPLPSTFHLYTIRSSGTAGMGSNAAKRTLNIQFGP